MARCPLSLPAVLERLSPSSLLARDRQGLTGALSLPEADGLLSHQYVQWWYWTGHLRGPCRRNGEIREFGYEVVFFVFNSWGIKSTLSQAALTDVTEGTFHFGQGLDSFLPEKLAGRFDMKSSVALARGGAGEDHLESRVDGRALCLDLSARLAPVRHYGGYPHPYRFGGYTYYYSRPGMDARGTVALGGDLYDVEGSGWFDRQYGDLYQAIDLGWQWFSIDLDDGRRIMLFDFEDRFRYENAGALVDPSGQSRPLGRGDFSVRERGRRWQSPHTGAKYPAEWELSVLGEDFVVRPLVQDQELRPQGMCSVWIGPEYWEGACRVEGACSGRAYVELNGFAESGVIANLLKVGSILFPA